jgi:hypothetical protein
MAAAYFVAGKTLDAKFPNYVFWMEALGLISFGFSWLAASRTIPIITNSEERFRLMEGRAPEDPSKGSQN